MLSARSMPIIDPGSPAFHPRVIDGSRPAIDMDGLMAAADFDGYDQAVVVAYEPSPSIWDDALDVRIACL